MCHVEISLRNPNFIEKSVSMCFFRWEIEISLRNRNFVEKSKFHWEIEISLRNWNFVEKSKFRWEIEISLRNRNFVEKSKFRWEIEISLRNRNFVEKSKFRWAFFHWEIEISLDSTKKKTHWNLDFSTKFRFLNKISTWHMNRTLLIKILPNEKLIFHNDSCKPKKSLGKKCHFQGAVWDFLSFGLCNFFLVLFSGDSTVESNSSREVGLHKVPLVFWLNPTRAEIFRPTELKGCDCTCTIAFTCCVLNRTVICANEFPCCKNSSQRTWTTLGGSKALMYFQYMDLPLELSIISG